MLLINSKGSKKNEGIAVLQNPIKNILNFQEQFTLLIPIL